MNFWTGWFIGTFACLIGSIVGSWDSPTTEQVGKTWQELNSEKELCEIDQPRHKICKATIKWEVIDNE